MISAELFHQAHNQPNKEKQRFFRPIEYAWDVLAVDRGKWNGERRYEALSQHLNREYPGETTIKLDPFQTRIIDALTEAFDIPHERGQAEIEISEELRSTKKG
jgi:hypothetical protein